MKKFLVAMLLAILPAAANASVTVQFGGIADLASYTLTHSSSTGDSIVNDAGTPTVSGSIVIALGALTNQPGASVYYDASGAAFLTGSFTSSGVTPALLTSGAPAHYVEGDGDSATIEFDYFDDAALGSSAPYSSQFTVFGDGVPLTVIDGIQLPDFANATNLYFSLISRTGDEFDYVELYSAGTVTTLTVLAPQVATAVPEPANWAMLILGFGAAGAALRRRPSPLAA